MMYALIILYYIIIGIIVATIRKKLDDFSSDVT